MILGTHYEFQWQKPKPQWERFFAIWPRTLEDSRVALFCWIERKQVTERYSGRVWYRYRLKETA